MKFLVSKIGPRHASSTVNLDDTQTTPVGHRPAYLNTRSLSALFAPHRAHAHDAPPRYTAISTRACYIFRIAVLIGRLKVDFKILFGFFCQGVTSGARDWVRAARRVHISNLHTLLLPTTTYLPSPLRLLPDCTRFPSLHPYQHFTRYTCQRDTCK